MKFEWENIHRREFNDVLNATTRAKVFGGWVLHHLLCDENESSQSESMVFIPDPNHEWQIE